MSSLKFPISKGDSCDLPRRKEAIEAILTLAWKKNKSERPIWLSQELNAYTE